MSLMPNTCPRCRRTASDHASAHVQKLFIQRCADLLEQTIDEAPMGVGLAYRRVREIVAILRMDPQDKERLAKADKITKRFDREKIL